MQWEVGGKKWLTSAPKIFAAWQQLDSQWRKMQESDEAIAITLAEIEEVEAALPSRTERKVAAGTAIDTGFGGIEGGALSRQITSELEAKGSQIPLVSSRAGGPLNAPLRDGVCFWCGETENIGAQPARARERERQALRVFKEEAAKGAQRRLDLACGRTEEALLEVQLVKAAAAASESAARIEAQEKVDAAQARERQTIADKEVALQKVGEQADLISTLKLRQSLGVEGGYSPGAPLGNQVDWETTSQKGERAVQVCEPGQADDEPAVFRDGGSDSGGGSGPAFPGRYEYVLRFANTGTTMQNVAQKLLGIMSAHEGLSAELVVSEKSDGGQASLLVTASSQAFDRQAEHDETLKLTKSNDRITGAQRLELFSRATRNDFVAYGSADFYLACERSHMVFTIMSRLRAIDDDCLPLVESVAKTMPNFRTVISPALQHESLIAAFQRCGLLDLVSPLHELDLRQALWRQTAALSRAPVDSLREYYGEHIAYYFVWLDFVTIMLIGPSIAGCFVWAMREPEQNIRTDTRNTYYSFGVVVWGFLFLAMWTRQANEYAAKWNTLDMAHDEEPNPKFFGKQRKSSISGEMEWHYASHWRWFVHYPVSAGVTFLMLLVALGAMSLSLNLQGCEYSLSLLHSFVFVPHDGSHDVEARGMSLNIERPLG